MNTPASRANGAVTVLVSRRVRPGHLPGCTSSMDALLRTAAAFPGHMGGKLILPQNTARDTFAHAAVASRDAASLSAWQDSGERARAPDSVSMHVVGGQALVRRTRNRAAGEVESSPAHMGRALPDRAPRNDRALGSAGTLADVALHDADHVGFRGADGVTIGPTLNRRFARWLRAEAALHPPSPLEPIS